MNREKYDVDDILQQIKKEKQAPEAIDREEPADTTESETPLRRTPTGPFPLLSATREIDAAGQDEDPRKADKGKKKKERKKKKTEEMDAASYWGNIRGIGEREGHTAKELMRQRVEEKARIQTVENQPAHNGVRGKIAMEELSRTTDLPAQGGRGRPLSLNRKEEDMPPAKAQSQEPRKAGKRMPAEELSEDTPVKIRSWKEIIGDEEPSERASGPEEKKVVSLQELRKQKNASPRAAPSKGMAHDAEASARRAPEGAADYIQIPVTPPAAKEKPDSKANYEQLMENIQNPAPSSDTAPFTLSAEEKLEEQRRHRAEKFVLFGDDEEDEESLNETEPEEEETEIEDFERYEDAPSILKDFAGLLLGQGVRFVLLALLLIASVYLSLSVKYELPLPKPIAVGTDPFLFTVVNLATLLAGLAAGGKTVFSGFRALFTLRANTDSLCSVVMLAAFVQNVFLLFHLGPVKTGELTLFLPSALLALLLNTVGKFLIVSRTRLNFKLVSSKFDKRSVEAIENEEFFRYIPHDTEMDESIVCTPVKAGLLSRFLENSYNEDTADRVCRWAVPITLVFGLVLGVVSFLLQKDAAIAVTTACSAISMASPAACILTVNIPLCLVSAKLVKRGAMVASYEACERFGDVNSIVLNLRDIFPDKAIELHSIKTFKDERIDEVLLDVASLTNSVGHLLNNMFLQIIEYRSELLSEVESVAYEENMGISGWVNTQRVLLGNKELMRNHEISIPGDAFEEKYLSQGLDLVYFARGGKLSAIFIVKYMVAERMKEALSLAEQEGMRIYVKTYDANMTDKKLALLFGTQAGTLTVLPYKAFPVYDEVAAAKDKTEAGIAFTSDISALIRALTAAAKVRSTCNISNILLMCCMGVGLFLVGLLMILGAQTQANALSAIMYQGFWSVIFAAVAALHRF